MVRAGDSIELEVSSGDLDMRRTPHTQVKLYCLSTASCIPPSSHDRACTTSPTRTLVVAILYAWWTATNTAVYSIGIGGFMW